MAKLLRAIPRLLKSILPSWIVRLKRNYVNQRLSREFQGASPEAIFSTIYKRGLWGGDTPADGISSGAGSHSLQIVEPYVSAVVKFLLGQFGSKQPRAVDLGCGDFFVGSQIRQYCASYIACDVVPAVIELNKDRYKAADVEFRKLDIVDDELPDADVAFIRQVLQHLSNEQISKIVSKLNKYEWLVLTEHIPGNKHFSPNVDKPTGGGIRIGRSGHEESGVVITESPFLFSYKDCRVICEVAQYGGVIQTVVYRNDRSRKAEDF